MKKLLSLIMLLAGVTQISLAQSLEDHLIKAAENNPELKAYYNEYLAASERGNQVSLPDPELQVGIFLQPMMRLMGIQQADVQLMQMFPWFGMLKAQESEADQMALARYQLFLDAKNNLFYQVKTTWYALAELEQEIRITEENLKILQQYERMALIRFESAANSSAGSNSSPMASAPSASFSTGSGGMNTMGNQPEGMSNQAKAPAMASPAAMGSTGPGMTDVLRIRLQINALENDLELLKSNKEPLEIELNKLMNVDRDSQISNPEPLLPFAMNLEKQAILDSISSNNPMIAMYDAELSALESQKQMARLDGRPMFGAGVNYMPFKPRIENGMPMGGDDMFMPMVTMTLPIYRKKTNARIKEAELLQESVRYKKENTLNQLEIAWAKSFRDLEDANRKVKLYEQQLELAKQSLSLLLTSYATNGQDFEEVLRAQQLVLDYEFSKIAAITRQYTSLAMLDMLSATGIQPYSN
ncbi:outer membrane protein TolC [Algoriphagus ratkowskyi]|uniref:Outer membrane protein TolC n=1 Tax=Algoriphagus ratkowskyi TaxID=57028 RepID=A0A2W7QX19_9BACT|nr:TolC family protein [Algoriphagus ratkowskyi]PZX52481.1 outer membrane protein TolC [Algoriphagus ratkowskyi]TXD76176.1 TolC family protein [Algoriphagus ratkowskyi]